MSTLLFEAKDLHRSFGGVHAVRGVSMQVEVGELRCIVGPNGAGKSTFFNMLCGTVQPSSGKIFFEGRDVTGLPLHRFAHIGICRKFQAPSVFPRLSVWGNLDVARHRGQRQGHSVREVLRLIDLEEIADLPAAELSHGRKQWLEIGMGVIGAPKLLLLDEPTAGMTRSETSRTAALIKQLQRECAIIVIEHDMGFVRELGCRTTVLHQGQIIRDGRFDEIEADETVRNVYLGRQ